MLYFPKKIDRIFTRKKSKIMIVMCWLVAFLAILPSIPKNRIDCRTRGDFLLHNKAKIVQSRPKPSKLSKKDPNRPKLTKKDLTTYSNWPELTRIDQNWPKLIKTVINWQKFIKVTWIYQNWPEETILGSIQIIYFFRLYHSRQRNLPIQKVSVGSWSGLSKPGSNCS